MNPRRFVSSGGCTAVLLIAFAVSLFAPCALAFPPYKTTDADTADPRTLELRLGLVQLEREAEATEYTGPLLRANLGLPNKVELISEFEYRLGDNEFGDGAAGLKWAPIQGQVSYGIETLALLPVRPGDRGVGLESQLLATWRRSDEAVRVHFNAGGFHDPRGNQTINGWRASALAEFSVASYRPGIELFVRRKDGQDIDLRLGAGVIKSAGRFEFRSAAHVGVTRQAPDVVFNFWVSTKLPF